MFLVEAGSNAGHASARLTTQFKFADFPPAAPCAWLRLLVWAQRHHLNHRGWMSHIG